MSDESTVKPEEESKLTAAKAATGKEAAEGFPMPLMEFVQTYEHGRNVELKGGFVFYAKQAGLTSLPYDEWVERFEEFKTRPAGGA
jgi:hypothetical protein